MTEGERLDAIADLLARGFQRWLAAEIKPTSAPRNCQEPLDDIAAAEAPCESRARLPRGNTA